MGEPAPAEAAPAKPRRKLKRRTFQTARSGPVSGAEPVAQPDAAPGDLPRADARPEPDAPALDAPEEPAAAAEDVWPDPADAPEDRDAGAQAEDVWPDPADAPDDGDAGAQAEDVWEWSAEADEPPPPQPKPRRRLRRRQIPFGGSSERFVERTPSGRFRSPLESSPGPGAYASPDEAAAEHGHGVRGQLLGGTADRFDSPRTTTTPTTKKKRRAKKKKKGGGPPAPNGATFGGTAERFLPRRDSGHFLSRRMADPHAKSPPKPAYVHDEPDVVARLTGSPVQAPRRRRAPAAPAEPAEPEPTAKPMTRVEAIEAAKRRWHAERAAAAATPPPPPGRVLRPSRRLREIADELAAAERELADPTTNERRRYALERELARLKAEKIREERLARDPSFVV